MNYGAKVVLFSEVHKFGKFVVSLQKQKRKIMDLMQYIEQHSSKEDEALQQIYRDTNLYTVHPQMLCGAVEGRLLSIISKIVRPKRILELGTFTGYSALCLAEGLTVDGILHTIEKNDEMESRIRKNFALKPELAKKIELHIGDAKTTIEELQGEVFDLIFLDADKREYCQYYELTFPLLRKGGILLADNTLWSGHITDPAYDKDKQTSGLRVFNDMVAQDERAEKVILPLRDGLTIVLKK